jgi:predicted MFS family arabinose efflux permease
LWSHVVVRSLAFLAGYLDVARIGGILIVYAIARQHQISLILVGVILTAGGCGNLTGTVLSSLIQRRIRFGWALGSMLILFVLLWPLYGVASSPIFLGIVVASLALIDSISAILISSYRLAVVPDELQGRVGSVYRLIVFGSLALGQVVVGQCLDRFGVLTTVGILWSGLILFAFLMLASSQLRQVSSLREQ